MTQPSPSPALDPPPLAGTLALIEKELAPQRRRRHSGLLVANVGVVAALASLWSTEPGPLPLRLHVAFGAMVGIGAAWIVTLLWLRTRHTSLLADDRVALARVAVGASLVFAVVGTGIALGRAAAGPAWAVGSVGGSFLVVAMVMLVRATRQRALLRALRARLEAGA